MSKRRTTKNFNQSGISGRVFYSTRLTDIPQGTAIDTRERDMVRLKGLKLFFRISNNRQEPVVINLALVKCTPENRFLDSYNGVTSVPGFLRAYDSERGRDWDGGALGLDNMELSECPINQDQYTILMRKTFTLQNVGGGLYNTSNSKSYVRRNYYVRIGRQIRYTGANAADCLSALYLVYWATPFEGAATGSISGFWNIDFQSVAYFQDIGCS